MLHCKAELSARREVRKVVYDGRIPYIAYLDDGIWYHRYVIKDRVEFAPFNEQDKVKMA